MKIIDTNILNRFVKGEMSLDLSEKFFVTDDLKNEIENLKSISSDYKNKLEKLTFTDTHHYFNEAKYLENYKKFINKHSRIVSFYGLKGLGDISILAFIKTILNPVSPTLFESSNSIEVITNDHNLKEALKEEFGENIRITDPIINN